MRKFGWGRGHEIYSFQECKPDEKILRAILSSWDVYSFSNWILYGNYSKKDGVGAHELEI